MTAEEIEKKGERISTDLILELYVPMFEQKVKIIVCFDKENESLSEDTILTFQDFLSIPKEGKNEMFDFIWDYYTKSFNSYEYSTDDGKTNKTYTLEDSLRDRGIETKEKVKQKSKLDSIQIFNDMFLGYRSFIINLTTEWDLEHGLRISYADGKLDDIG